MTAAQRDAFPSSPDPPSSLPRLTRAGDLELVGRVIDEKYALARLIGRGGMGAVYEAEHLGLGRRVALKLVDADFASDESVVTRFAREARATSTIDSEHVVSAFDVGVADGRPYLVMELLRGEDLGQRMRRAGRVPLDEALHVTAQVLRGLARAHDAGIVHRDLKPDNVFLVRRDVDPLFVKLVDFGVSKVQRSTSGTVPLSITSKGAVIGTPLYMSPEQAQALPDVDGRADVWSAGVMLFECLAGRTPHRGSCYEQIIVAICMQDAMDVRVLAPDVPEGVAAWIARALARHRQERFQSAEEALEALVALGPRGEVPVSGAARVAPPVSVATRLAYGAATPVPRGVSPSGEASISLVPPVATSTVSERVPARVRQGPRVVLTAVLAMSAGVGAAAGWIRVRGPIARGAIEAPIAPASAPVAQVAHVATVVPPVEHAPLAIAPAVHAEPAPSVKEEPAKSEPAAEGGAAKARKPARKAAGKGNAHPPLPAPPADRGDLELLRDLP